MGEKAMTFQINYMVDGENKTVEKEYEKIQDAIGEFWELPEIVFEERKGRYINLVSIKEK